MDLSYFDEVHAVVCVASQTGWTPLHLACHRGHKELVDAIIRHGAKLDGLSKAGLTPRDLARASRHTQVVTVVEGAMQALAAEEQAEQEAQRPSKEQQLWQLVEAKDAMAVETLLRSGGVDADAPQPEVRAPTLHALTTHLGHSPSAALLVLIAHNLSTYLPLASSCFASPSSPRLLSTRPPSVSPANGATHLRLRPSSPLARRSIARTHSAGRR